MSYSCKILIISLLVVVRLLIVILIGNSFEGDEVVVLYWGRYWLTHDEWHLLSTADVASWETLSAYFYGGIDLLGINPRWAALALGFFEILIVYKWVTQVYNRDLAFWVALVMLALPYHLFFSLALGPLNAGVWTALYLWAEAHQSSRVFRFFVTVAGLMHYASFRLIYLWSVIKSIFDKKYFRIIPETMGLVTLLALLAIFFKDQLSYFFDKGRYLVDRGLVYFIWMYLQSLLIWLVPFFGDLFGVIQKYQFDDLGRAFQQMRGGDTPLSFPFSVAFAMGLWTSYQDRHFKAYLSLLLLAFLTVGWTATLVHFVFLIPVFALFIGYGLMKIKGLYPRGGLIVLVSFFAIVTLSNLAFLYRIKNPEPHYLMQDFIQETRVRVNRLVPDPSEVLYVASTQTLFLRYFAQKNNLDWTFFYENSDLWIIETRAKIQNENIRYMVVLEPHDSQSVNPEIMSFYKESLIRYQDNLKLIESNFLIKAKTDIVLANQLKVATLYEVDIKARY